MVEKFPAGDAAEDIAVVCILESLRKLAISTASDAEVSETVKKDGASSISGLVPPVML